MYPHTHALRSPTHPCGEKGKNPSPQSPVVAVGALVLLGMPSGISQAHEDERLGVQQAQRAIARADLLLSLTVVHIPYG